MMLLIVGKYQLLDSTIKIVIIILAVSTMVAAIVAFTGNSGSQTGVHNTFSWSKPVDILFIIAFAGWMPAPIDVSVWQSLWTVAKKESLKKKISFRNVLTDFRTGYIGTAFIAIFFMMLGKEVLYGTGTVLSPSGLNFSRQIIDIYTSTIGEWAWYIIALAALTTMFSTTITCLDAYPRVLKPITENYFPGLKKIKSKFDWHSLIWSLIVAGGAVVLLGYLQGTMQKMVDLATTISFVTAPVLAILNYRVVTDKHMPKEGRPGKWLKIYAWAGIVCLSLFTLFFLYWRFLQGT